MGVATIERWEPRTPHQRRKLPKLEHVALNSASETGAKMHQNAQICKLNFKQFGGGGYAPNPRTVDGLRRPSPDRTSLSSPSFGAFGPSIVPNQKSWIYPWAHSPSENPGYVYAAQSTDVFEGDDDDEWRHHQGGFCEFDVHWSSALLLLRIL